ncbi:hypothetical protein SGRA_1521 [Saprospira grandis str. Lewin]|uniref:Uncharacterized protein n=1 Tax=Saprospira grandis (strain Lewin) TaxID=984262 RepID=H6L984_SAPGL|nr:hypothetical protein SGRA_1521 [Saprospira grandis str. Lewin]
MMQIQLKQPHFVYLQLQNGEKQLFRTNLQLQNALGLAPELICSCKTSLA